MAKPHRIAAGGLIFKGNAVLLVRYRDSRSAQTYLVGPGGKLEDDENVVQAVIRETMEETRIAVRPLRVVAIEDLITTHYKMIKIWMACDFVKGEIRKTVEAEKEGIIAADWYTRVQLTDDVVFPFLLMEQDWERLRSGTDEVVCLPSRRAKF
jgi:8-oxo-dGTP pyrophosphatase MutT (NUDIX family)